MDIYLTYRDDDDASGFALNLRRELASLKADVTVTSGPVLANERPAALPRGATILMLVGTRWMRSAPKVDPYFADASDPMRRLLETAIKNRVKIVPVLFQVELSSWEKMCPELPPSLSPLAHFQAVEIRPRSFPEDLQALMTQLAGGDRSVPWTEAGVRTLICVQAEGGGALKWWSNRDKALRVLVDDTEVGMLTGWSGRFDAAVEPGRHSVQIRQGRFSKSGAVIVDAARGATVKLVCGRNIFTGSVSLERKG